MSSEIRLQTRFFASLKMTYLSKFMSLTIRPETPNDHAAVREIVRSSFPSDAEARLVDTLRSNGKAVISLVADLDGDVVGHILFSPVTTSPLSHAKGLGLAPLAVAAAHRCQGIGAALVREGLLLCCCDYVVVLGSPKYYGRFGFKRAGQFDLQNEYGVDEEFMVMEISGSCLRGVKGLAQYAPEFGNLGV